MMSFPNELAVAISVVVLIILAYLFGYSHGVRNTKPENIGELIVDDQDFYCLFDSEYDLQRLKKAKYVYMRIIHH